MLQFNNGGYTLPESLSRVFCRVGGKAQIMDLIEIRVARTQVRLYTSVLPLHSIDPRQPAKTLRPTASCEDILQLGINAFEWLKRTEKRWIEGIQSGTVQYDPEMQEAFDGLFEAWLSPCDRAKAKIAGEMSIGRVPENLEIFRRCCDEADRIVAQRSREHSDAQREEQQLAVAGRRALAIWAKENAP